MPVKDRQVALRIEQDYLDRADALVSLMESIPALAAMRITRAAVMRMAIVRGLEVLEEEHGVTPQS